MSSGIRVESQFSILTEDFHSRESVTKAKVRLWNTAAPLGTEFRIIRLSRLARGNWRDETQARTAEWN